MASDPFLDTASQRVPTGIDRSARRLILNALEGVSDIGVVDCFFRDRYGDPRDYVDAVRGVWGEDAAEILATEVTHAVNMLPTVLTPRDAYRAEQTASEAMLLYMPEPDFRMAVFDASGGVSDLSAVESRIARICKTRGIPWEFTLDQGFSWVGDEEVEERAMRPALSAVEDSRFTGVRGDFDPARAALAAGTPTDLKRCVHEAACAVESAMKVLLVEHGDEYAKNATAFKLFDRLVEVGRIPQFMQGVVLGAAWARNERGGHGPGAVPHDVAEEMAEAVLASAAVAIAYLHGRLPGSAL